jgi:hypothetical protein
MRKQTIEELMESFKESPDAQRYFESGPQQVFQIERETIEEGVSFSSEGMNTLIAHISSYIQCQVYKKWALSGEPPSAASVTVKIDVH